MSKKKRSTTIDEYALRQLRRLPPSQKSSIAKQVLVRFKVYQHPEHAEALAYLQSLPRGDVYDTIVRALLLYKDYTEALEGLSSINELRSWTMDTLLDEAAAPAAPNIEEEDSDNG